MRTACKRGACPARADGTGPASVEVARVRRPSSGRSARSRRRRTSAPGTTPPADCENGHLLPAATRSRSSNVARARRVPSWRHRRAECVPVFAGALIEAHARDVAVRSAVNLTPTRGRSPSPSRGCRGRVSPNRRAPGSDAHRDGRSGGLECCRCRHGARADGSSPGPPGRPTCRSRFDAAALPSPGARSRRRRRDLDPGHHAAGVRRRAGDRDTRSPSVATPRVGVVIVEVGCRRVGRTW